MVSILWPVHHLQLITLPMSRMAEYAARADRAGCSLEFITGRQLSMGKNASAWSRYRSDILNLFAILPPHYMDIPFLLRFGDCTDRLPCPIISKARRIGDQNAVLLPLNYDRHFGEAFRELVEGGWSSVRDYPFEDKIAKAIWRGSSTGYGWDTSTCAAHNPRRALVEVWGPANDSRVDVALSAFVQELEQRGHESWKRHLKPFKPINEQLKYRYLIAVEGNDVASGLKWMLASDSVVLMPLARKETWALESKLQPWVHFIPVREDFSDLVEKITWCERNLDKCLRVCKTATAYARQLKDRKSTFGEAGMILKRYLDSYRFRLAYM